MKNIVGSLVVLWMLYVFAVPSLFAHLIGTYWNAHLFLPAFALGLIVWLRKYIVSRASCCLVLFFGVAAFLSICANPFMYQ